MSRPSDPASESISHMFWRLTRYLCHVFQALNTYVPQSPCASRLIQFISSMDPLLEGLNAAQRTAVTSPAPVLQILAPPGSGKTKTLTARVAFLLSTGYRPENLICLTFTIKSAREMRDRISKLIGNGLEARIVLGTFHSVCRRYLISYGHLVGITKDFGIADSADSLGIIKVIHRAV